MSVLTGGEPGVSAGGRRTGIRFKAAVTLPQNLKTWVFQEAVAALCGGNCDIRLNISVCGRVVLHGVLPDLP